MLTKIFSEVAVQINNSMKQFDEIKPYFYIIYQKSTGKRYCGIRWKNWSTLGTTPRQDFWKVYFTSSDNIKTEIKINSLADFDAELRRTFETPEDADNWEKRFLRKVRALENQDKWWNANIGNNKVATERGRKTISETHKDKPKTEEHRKKIKLSNIGKNKGKKPTDEHRRKNSEAHKGEKNSMYGPCSEERAANISKAKKGKPAKNKGVGITEEQRQKIKDTKEKNKVMVTCEVCGKTMRESHFKIYGHGPACKQKPA